jgi:hypothetical protein
MNYGQGCLLAALPFSFSRVVSWRLLFYFGDFYTLFLAVFGRFAERN